MNAVAWPGTAFIDLHGGRDVTLAGGLDETGRTFAS